MDNWGDFIQLVPISPRDGGPPCMSTWKTLQVPFPPTKHFGAKELVLSILVKGIVLRVSTDLQVFFLTDLQGFTQHLESPHHEWLIFMVN